MPESREDSVYLAKLAEQAERYEGSFLSSIDSCATTELFYLRLPRDGRKHEACCLIRSGIDR